MKNKNKKKPLESLEGLESFNDLLDAKNVLALATMFQGERQASLKENAVNKVINYALQRHDFLIGSINSRYLDEGKFRAILSHLFNPRKANMYFVCSGSQLALDILEKLKFIKKDRNQTIEYYKNEISTFPLETLLTPEELHGKNKYEKELIDKAVKDFDRYENSSYLNDQKKFFKYVLALNLFLYFKTKNKWGIQDYIGQRYKVAIQEFCALIPSLAYLSGQQKVNWLQTIAKVYEQTNLSELALATYEKILLITGIVDSEKEKINTEINFEMIRLEFEMAERAHLFNYCTAEESKARLEKIIIKIISMMGIAFGQLKNSDNFEVIQINSNLIEKSLDFFKKIVKFSDKNEILTTLVSDQIQQLCLLDISNLSEGLNRFYPTIVNITNYILLTPNRIRNFWQKNADWCQHFYEPTKEDVIASFINNKNVLSFDKILDDKNMLVSQYIGIAKETVDKFSDLQNYFLCSWQERLDYFATILTLYVYYSKFKKTDDTNSIELLKQHLNIILDIKEFFAESKLDCREKAICLLKIAETLSAANVENKFDQASVNICEEALSHADKIIQPRIKFEVKSMISLRKIIGNISNGRAASKGLRDKSQSPVHYRKAIATGKEMISIYHRDFLNVNLSDNNNNHQSIFKDQKLECYYVPKILYYVAQAHRLLGQYLHEIRPLMPHNYFSNADIIFCNIIESIWVNLLQLQSPSKDRHKNNSVKEINSSISLLNRYVKKISSLTKDFPEKSLSKHHLNLHENIKNLGELTCTNDYPTQMTLYKQLEKIIEINFQGRQEKSNELWNNLSVLNLKLSDENNEIRPPSPAH